MINETQTLLIDVVRYRLFDGEKPKLNNHSLKALLKEAESQAVYNTVFPVVEDEIQTRAPQKYPQLLEKYLAKLIVNTGNFHDHGELDRLMVKNSIPYVAIKGVASAYYYKSSEIRDMGDVDLLVNESDVSKAGKAAETLGYKYDHGDEGSTHIAYSRKGLSVLEIHRSVNGIPNNELGKLIKAEIKNTIQSARRIEYAGESCFIPDELHHGLIMLLHMISHMTKEGIGLRHLCDWAVFENSFSESEFKEIFEEKLKSFGLWKFTCILCLVCEKYLGTKKKEFAVEAQTDGELPEKVMEDILNGGNFGTKDMNRYREIKYISDREGNTVSGNGVVFQAFSSLNAKAKDNKLVKKTKLLLPVGWVVESGKYLGLVLSGKRKNKATSEMLKEASKRRNIYNSFELFK